MAYSRSTRRRARSLYVQDGWSYRRIAEELGVGKTTLLRWAQSEDWDTLREQSQEIELESRSLLLRMIEAAGDSRDPQATYAAVQAARLAGVSLGPPQPSEPSPKQVAVVLLDVLAKHHAVGPVVRGHRNEVLRLFATELERMAGSGSGAGP